MPGDMSVARAANSQVRNAPVVFTPLHGTAEATVGENQVPALRNASMGAEDFSFYLEQIPGCYVRLSV